VNKIQKWRIITEKRTSLSYLNTAAVYTVTTNLAEACGTLEALGHCIAICGRLMLKVCMYSMFVKQCACFNIVYFRRTVIQKQGTQGK
jgi:hypothetical protein